MMRPDELIINVTPYQPPSAEERAQLEALFSDDPDSDTPALTNGDSKHHYLDYQKLDPQNIIITAAGPSKFRRCLRFSPIAFLYVCTFFALSRNFAGGYELIDRVFPEETPKTATIICGTLLGAGASYSPFHQIKSGIHTIEKLFQNPKKKTLLKLLVILCLFGLWSGMSFAEMGASSFQKMLSTDWNLGDNIFIDLGMDVVFGMTLITNTIMYTEKLYNLKLKTMWQEIKQSPRKAPLFLINMISSGLGVVTNQVFGAQAAHKFIDNDVSCQIIGVVTAIGPWGMNVASMNDVVKSASDSFCPSICHSTDSIVDEDAKPAVNFSWELLGWKIVLLAFVAAAISAAPNLEYNLEANAGKSIFSYIFIFFGIIYNVIPKAAATIRNKYKEIKKLSANSHRLLPVEKLLDAPLSARPNSASFSATASFAFPPS